MFELAVEGLLGRMQTAADQGSSICLTEEFLRMTTRFLYRFAFGITLDEDHEKAVFVGDFFDAIGSAAFDIASIDTPMDNENVRRHRSARLAMDAEVDEIISQCQDQDCVLRSFLDASARDGGLTIEDVRAEIVGLFLAGTETTSLTLAWLFLLLDAHPAFCERVIAEQDAGTGSMELEAAVFETLRLFPPVPFLTRIVEEPVELDSRALEVGTVLLVSIYHLHRNPKHWSEPEVFNPARFHDMQDRHRYAFLPFGGGRHLCIGQNIAVKETLCAASAILKRFTLKRIDDQPIVARMGLTLKPATQVRVRPVVRA